MGRRVVQEQQEQEVLQGVQAGQEGPMAPVDRPTHLVQVELIWNQIHCQI